MESVENTDEKGGGIRQIVSQSAEEAATTTTEPTTAKMGVEDRALVRQI